MRRGSSASFPLTRQALFQQWFGENMCASERQTERRRDCSEQPEDRDIALIPTQIKGFTARSLITDPEKEKEEELSLLLPLFCAD